MTSTLDATDPASLAALAYATGSVAAPGGPIAPTVLMSERPAPILGSDPGAVQVSGNIFDSISSWWNTSLLNPVHDATAVGNAINTAATNAGAAVSAASNTVSNWLMYVVIGLGIYLAIMVWRDLHA